MALNASHRLEHGDQYQGAIQDFLNQIDQIVANHHSTTVGTTSAFRKREEE